MESSASESVSNAYFNLERLSRSFRRPTPAGNFDRGTTDNLERLWFRRRPFHVPNLMTNYNNVFFKQFDRNEHFSAFDFSSGGIKIGSESIQRV